MMRGRKSNKVLTSSDAQKRINDAKSTDKRIKYCNVCNKCWENFINDRHNMFILFLKKIYPDYENLWLPF